jgi:hypothetical protein
MVTVETICKLYYNYGKRTDNEIREVLKDTKLVTMTNKGSGTIQGYYEVIGGDNYKKMIKSPREIAINLGILDGPKLSKEPVNLVIFDRIPFLVKSSSRFVYKPDIGEVIDQIDWITLRTINKIYAIDLDTMSYEALPNTDGEHFVCYINLLAKPKKP